VFHIEHGNKFILKKACWGSERKEGRPR